MGTIRAWTALEYLRPDGRVERLGSRVEPTSVTILDDEFLDQNIVLATTQSVVVWQASQSYIADFDFIFVKSDQDDVLLELIADENGGGAGTVAMAVELKKGVGFILASDDSLAGNTGNFNSTADVIDKIALKNNNPATANIRFFLVS